MINDCQHWSLLLSLFIYHCVWQCLWTWVHASMQEACVYTCVKARTHVWLNITYHSSGAIYPDFWNRVSSWDLGLANYTRLPGQWALGSVVSSWIHKCIAPHSLFTWCLGVKPRSSHLQGQYLTHGAVSSAHYPCCELQPFAFYCWTSQLDVTADVMDRDDTTWDTLPSPGLNYD